jgi:nitronate monooxygenase
MELEASGAKLEDLIQAATGEKARRIYGTGDITCGVLSCGQGVGLARDIPTVKELFDRIMDEAQSTIRNLALETE